MHPKPKRERSESVLDAFRAFPCAICLAPPPSDPDHLVSRGAGGDDSVSNLWPLCRSHHQERHLIGLIGMIQKYQKARAYFILTGRGELVERAMQGLRW